jgi:spore germination protein YaaH
MDRSTDRKNLKNFPNKIILGLGAYGYDWSTNKDDNNSVTYMQAITKASASKAKINFDDNTFNLNYSYTDSKNNTHTVFFNDAASIFNTMRFSEYPLPEQHFGDWEVKTAGSGIFMIRILRLQDYQN